MLLWSLSDGSCRQDAWTIHWYNVVYDTHILLHDLPCNLIFNVFRGDLLNKCIAYLEETKSFKLKDNFWGLLRLPTTNCYCLVVLWNQFPFLVTLCTAEWKVAKSFSAAISSSGAIWDKASLLFTEFSWPIVLEVCGQIFFLVCLNLETPLKPVYHGWPWWYLKYWWHSFRHHSNIQLLQYDNQQTDALVPWPGNEPGPQRWEWWMLTTRQSGQYIYIKRK